MMYQIFTKLLTFKPCRKLLLSLKKNIPDKLQIIAMLHEWKQKDFVFQSANLNLLGQGSLNSFNKICDHYTFKVALIITDPVLIKIGIVQKVINQLEKNKIRYFIYDGVIPNPTIGIVNEIVKKYISQNCDALISVGGGSAHDSTKAASLIISNDEKEIRRYQGLNNTRNAIKMPIIAINTTAGTGSGSTNVAVITDEKNHFKMTLVDKHIQPHILIDDSELMMDLPIKPSMWVGVDTLVHAIEAYLSPVQNIMVQVYAKRAMKLVYEYLPKIYKDPKNKVFREKLAYAEFLGGTAFNSASLGFVHSLSHAMSGIFNTPHGLANAIILPYVLDYELYSQVVIDRLCEINDFIGFPNKYEDELNKAKECIVQIVRFLRKIDIPIKLADIQPNITNKELHSMVIKAMKDFCGVTNPVQFSKHEVKQIYQNAISGKFNNIKYEENS